jgi:S-methylmethionine-dependent homocysteine/selenocysteine methylase
MPASRATRAAASSSKAPPGARAIDWGDKLGYREADLVEVNRQSIALLVDLRDACSRRDSSPMVISGCVGPRGDGYEVDAAS